MKIPQFLDVRESPSKKKRYYLFDKELELNFKDGQKLFISRSEEDVKVCTKNPNVFIEIAGSKRSEYVFYKTSFFSFMGTEIIVDNFRQKENFGDLFYSEGLFSFSQSMQKTCTELIDHVRQDDIVFLYGETGTGKEFLAKSIHYNSRRKFEPFVVINTGLLEKERADCELFGSVKGSYTNSVCNLKGAFLNAGAGTLVIDDISNISMDIQAKLLRAIEYGEIKPVGCDLLKKHHARLIILSSQSPEALLKNKKIREDLFYRIERFSVKIPELEDRVEDIIPLASFFAGQEFSFTEDAGSLLGKHRWPGNVRELKNCIERACLYSRNKIIDAGILVLRPFLGNSDKKIDRLYFTRERELVRSVLNKNDYNVSKTSRDLGVSRSTLISKIKYYRLIH